MSKAFPGLVVYNNINSEYLLPIVKLLNTCCLGLGDTFHRWVVQFQQAEKKIFVFTLL